MPGGKTKEDETAVDSLKRELKEELDVTVTSEKFLGHVKVVRNGKVFRIHYFDVTIDGTPTIQEPAKHGMLERVEQIPAENSLGYVVKFDQTIITDEYQLQHDFVNIALLQS